MADNQTEAMALLWAQSQAEADQQSSDIDALRTRAVALLSVEALVGGLFGSRLPHSHLSHLNVAGLVSALALFGLSVGLAVAISWPRTWDIGGDRDDLATGVAEGKVSLSQVNYALAWRADQNWSTNYRKLARLYRLFSVLCALVAVQVIAWALAVI